MSTKITETFTSDDFITFSFACVSLPLFISSTTSVNQFVYDINFLSNI